MYINSNVLVLEYWINLQKAGRKKGSRIQVDCVIPFDIVHNYGHNIQ